MLDNIDTLKIFADDKRMIAYRPEWRAFAGSVTAAILLQQILYRWDQNGRRPFYKFKESCTHELYRPGDSWTEELGFSKREFDSALKLIAMKRSKADQELHKSCVEYWTDMNRITYYTVNSDILESKISALYVKRETVFTQSANQDLRKAQNGIYVNSEKGFSKVKCETGFTKSAKRDLEYNTEITYKENTTDKDVQNCHAQEQEEVSQEKEVVPSSSFSLGIFLEGLDISLVPEKFRQSKPLLTRIEKALEKHDKEYVSQTLMYACDHSKALTAQTFGAFFGRALEKGWGEGYSLADMQKKQTKLDRIRLEEQEQDRKRREEQARLKVMHEALVELQETKPEKYAALEKQAADALGLKLHSLKSVIGGGLKVKHKMFEIVEQEVIQ